MKTRVLKFAVMLTLVSMCGGCIVYRGDRVAPVSQFPQTQAKNSVDVDFAYEVMFNNRPLLAGVEKTRSEMEARCLQRLQNSRLFGEVSTNKVAPDLKVQVKMVDAGEGNFFMARLCGATLMLIPCRAKDNYKMSAVVVDARTNRREEINLEESLTLWMHILFLPVAPFNSLDKETKKLLDICFDNLALEIEKRGMLKGA